MRLVFGALVLFISLTVTAQQSPEKALQQFAENYPQEKVVLLFSKPGYVAGETIYFKAWVLSGYEPSPISTNLYTELYDKEKNLLQKQLIPLLQGSGNGQFTLPASLAEDVYYIRAYTQWMRNFDERFFCLKPLYLYNPNSSQSLRAQAAQWKAAAFAEGGTLLDNVPANVAVRLHTTGSLPTRWTGQLLEEGAIEPVANLSVFNSEIGQVRFIPTAGKNYIIKVQDDAGKSQELILPAVQTSGIALQAGVLNGKLRYGLLFKDLPAGGMGYRLMASFNNEPVVMASVARSLSQASGVFDVSQLPAGILQLTLFNERTEPVIERLLFLNQETLSTPTLSIQTDSLSTAPRSRNHWTIRGDTINLANTVVQVNDAALPGPTGFLGDVYFGSDLSTPVQEADWYLTEVTPAKAAALDALLLTEKWSRFSWASLQQNRFPALRFKPDSYLQFTGTVHKGKKRIPLREMTLVVQTVDSSLSFLQVKTDSAGQLSFSNLIFTDSIRVYYQPGKRKFLEGEPEISFTTENHFAPFSSGLPVAAMTAGPRARNEPVPVAIERAVQQRLAEMVLTEKTKMLDEVVITAKARDLTRELDEKLSSGLFSGGNAAIFDFVNENQAGAFAYSNILEWLQGRVPGFTLQRQDGVLVPQIRNSTAQLFLDEMNITPDVLNGLSAADVAMIKVFRMNFAGSFGGGSAIAIYTRRGGMPSANNRPTLPVSVLRGYTRFTPPLMPDYFQNPLTDVKDNRLVLHYDPLLQAATGATSIPVIFYNNDIAKQYRLLVAGFTANGQLVYINRQMP
jgi:hypothetical protein